MSVEQREDTQATPGRVLALLAAVALLLPGVVIRLTGAAPAPLVAVLVYGAAFVGAALLLAWGAELAQLDLPPGLAVAILAFIAILPEYAVDLLFAYQAGNDPSKAPLALANMTGANRLLIGIGWSLIVLVAALGARRARRSERSGPGTRQVRYGMSLSRLAAVDVVILGAASLYALSFVFRSTLTLVDTAVLFGLFGVYVYRLWTAPQEDPEFIGPPVLINRLPTGRRRLVTVALMVGAAAVILLVAEPFSAGLVEAGAQLGINQFLLVQWIAPLATETAELIPAAIFAFRQRADEGLGTLLSSKINQWTLLVGAIPIAFAVSTTGVSGLPIDPIQQQELFLTAAQSIFAVSLLVDLRLTVREAVLILTLFLVDFTASVVLTEDLLPWVRFGFAGLYLLLAAARLATSRRRIPALVRDGVAVAPRTLAAQTR